uniref:Replication protein A OB domain-containing protein n=1 Tax=Chenopodium quinoa TaxID=63459 RepID=A0A803M6F6_CHEQI
MYPRPAAQMIGLSTWKNYESTTNEPLIISAWGDVTTSGSEKLKEWPNTFLVVSVTSLKPADVHRDVVALLPMCHSSTHLSSTRNAHQLKADDTGTFWLTAFDPICEQILNLTTDEIFNKKIKIHHQSCPLAY